MDIRNINKLIQSTIICTGNVDVLDFEYAFSSDLMSDVLCVDKEKVLLITGLANLQVIRTAEMSDIQCIIFARGKKISHEMKNLAIENSIALFECENSVFKISGILYEAGIKPLF